jgi:hypothetical protein
MTYHVIDAPAIHDAVAFLLDHLPRRVSIANRNLENSDPSMISGSYLGRRRHARAWSTFNT